MALLIYQSVYLPTCLSTYIPTYLSAEQPIYQCTCAFECCLLHYLPEEIEALEIGYIKYLFLQTAWDQGYSVKVF